MKLSYAWLSEYVEHGLSPEALADTLTMLGLEVEGLEQHGPGLAGVVVGHVLEVRPHPNADRLVLCDVDLGEGEPVQIVCGAPNVAAGQRVPVATVGATLMLPSRTTGEPEPVTIARATLRGEASSGMICSEAELGLGEEHGGILVLEDDAEAGQPFEAYLARHGRLERDATLDVALTPNRPDAASHIGIARDVAAVTGQALRLPEVAVPEAGGEAAEAVAVEIEAPEACGRYVGILVRGVTVGPSPAWLQRRLEAVGLRPINNVVDATNFVMYEVGQPLHAFDLALLAGGEAHEARIIVRQAEAPEPFVTLDGAERTLPAGTLLIADAERAVAVAGVMGGANSEVGPATRDVLIESAYFDPVAVRTAARALGLQTDASYRFERGVDPCGQAWAAARAAALIAQVAGGEVVPGMVDAHPRPVKPRRLTLHPRRIEEVLGVAVPEREAERLLTAIGFELDEGGMAEALAERARKSGLVPLAQGEVGRLVTVPTFRPDVEREIDLIEEVARLYGYDRIPAPAQAPIPLTPPRPDREARLRERAERLLTGLGFREIYTNSLLPAATAEALATPSITGLEMGAAVTANALSREMAALRPSLLPGLLAATAHNQNRGAGALRFFEMGHVYGRADGLPGPIPGYHEHAALGIGLSGPAQEAGWDAPEREADFFDLKGVVAHLLAGLGLEDVEEIPEPEADEHTAYRLALASEGRRIGLLARVSDALAEASDLRRPLFFAEIHWEALAEVLLARPEARYRPIPRTPTLERDLAVTVERAVPVGPMLRTVRAAGGALLRRVRVFDLYEGERIGAGKKSVAFALRFGAEQTLTDEAADRQVRRIVAALEREHGAQLRA